MREGSSLGGANLLPNVLPPHHFRKEACKTDKEDLRNSWVRNCLPLRENPEVHCFPKKGETEQELMVRAKNHRAYNHALAGLETPYDALSLGNRRTSAP